MVFKKKSKTNTINTAEYLMNHIKQHFDQGNDIAEALRTLQQPNMNGWQPSLQMSVNTDESMEKRENKQFEILYQAELEEYMLRSRMYKNCNKAMQAKVSARTDYQTGIYNNPIRLLQVIKEHALNYQQSRYEMAIITVFNCRQKEKESLQDYTRRFKTAKEVLETHIGGPVQLDKYETIVKKDSSGLTSLQKRPANDYLHISQFYR